LKLIVFKFFVYFSSIFWPFMTELAQSSLEERLRQQPEDFEALVLLGQVSWEQNQKEDSLSYFLKAAKVRGSGALGTSFMGPE
jgi:hypothetical protein